jgi:hypothetical protein
MTVPDVAPLWPAAHLPLKAGDCPPAATLPFILHWWLSGTPERMISPSVWEMACRPEGGATERRPIRLRP